MTDLFKLMLGILEVVRIVSTLFRSADQTHTSAAEIMAQVNNALCRDNQAMMFVTLFFGIIDPRSGELEFCNAGHNAPFLLRLAGDLNEISGSKGRPLGIRSASIYESGHLNLDFSDCLFLFTDGVTESMNEQNELFKEERVERILRSHVPPGPSSIIPAIMSAIIEFRGTAPQADDITMLALRRLRVA
jgi:sigma-B regulation protein RsbU (phosphoserine phosphatase)